MTWANAITLAIAILGAVLGVINTWNQLSKNQVRLRVVPKQAHLVNSQGVSPPRLCIEVINLSSFAVTVDDVGLVDGSIENTRLSAWDPILLDRGPWPRRLNSRESVTVHFDLDAQAKARLVSMTRAYASTQCGETRYSKGNSLRGFIKTMARATR